MNDLSGTHSPLSGLKITRPELTYSEIIINISLLEKRGGGILDHSKAVYTYADIFKSTTFSFRIRLLSTRIQRIQQQSRKKSIHSPEWKKINPQRIRNKSNNVKSVSSLSLNSKPIWQNVSGERSKFPATILLYRACSEDILLQRSLGY